jgi:hypothetical protein
LGGERAEVARDRTNKRRRHRWVMWAGGVLVLILMALAMAITVMLRRAEPMLRAVIIERLQDRFHARVELDSFHLSLTGGLRAEGKGLRIWPPAEVEGVTVPGASGLQASSSGRPLIQLDDFRFRAPLHFDRDKPIKISVVQLKGLLIDIPPKTHFTHAAATGESSSEEKQKIGAALVHFEIDSIICKDAHVTLETSKPGKLPLEFAIDQMKLTDVTADAQAHFDAVLINPKPAGTIMTSGTAGPWDVEDPGETPVAGTYQFEHADLGVFKGIAGILDSTGRYAGALRNIVVDGETSTPDFRLTHFGTAVPLNTTFHATVDGTNGDTWLQPVHAVLGQSHFTCEGEIIRSEAMKLSNGTERPAGHDIRLKVNIPSGKMEDFLKLTSKSGTPLLTGDLILKTTLDIPPGTQPVHERMKLNGSFSLEDAHFASERIQNYMEQLSLRGQGDAKDAKQAKQEGESDVRAAMQSDFTMAGGVIDLPDLKYNVPGAEIDLAGRYGVAGSTLNFAGTARMQATVSQMVGGWKGLLLKPADRIFKKDGAGTEIAIHLDGTRDDPKFGVDLHGVKHTHPAVPGQPE